MFSIINISRALWSSFDRTAKIELTWSFCRVGSAMVIKPAWAIKGKRVNLLSFDKLEISLSPKWIPEINRNIVRLMNGKLVQIIMTTKAIDRYKTLNDIHSIKFFDHPSFLAITPSKLPWGTPRIIIRAIEIMSTIVIAKKRFKKWLYKNKFRQCWHYFKPYPNILWASHERCKLISI